MHIYKLTPSSSEQPHVEHINTKEELYNLSGKFLYFTHYDSLIVVDDPDIFHKDIYELAKHAVYNSEPLVTEEHHPHGFGKLHHGKVENWESHYFGQTPEDLKKIISDGLVAHF
jgi:hypothetical protein